MLLFSARAGAVAQRIGPRLPLTIGPIVLAASLLSMHTIGVDSSYVTGVLPPVILLAVGLVIVVAPVTATTLAAAPDEHAGVASAVSNAVSRTGQLFAIALLPAIGGLRGSDYGDPSAIASAFQTAVLFSAGLCLVGAVIAWTMVDNDALKTSAGPAPSECGVEGAPLTAGVGSDPA
jgi:hypothetical protein